MRYAFRFVMFVFFLFFLALFLGLIFPLEIFLALLFGWFYLFYQGIPHVEWNIGGIIFLFVFAGAIFYFVNRYAKSHFEDWNLPQWNLRRGLSICCMLILSGIAVTSIAGVCQQIYGICFEDSSFLRTPEFYHYKMTHSKNNMKDAGLGAHNFHDVYEAFPVYGYHPEEHSASESFTTQLLPFLDQGKLYQSIDFNVPWDDPKNRKVFQTKLDFCLNPQIKKLKQEETGYYLTHYAENALLFARTDKLGIRDIKDGTANTIMSGEVSANFSPWGKPGNWRDPRIGLSNPEVGFRGPFPGRTLFLLPDGTVRYINNDIDLKVLKALSTPAGGDEVPDDF